MKVGNVPTPVVGPVIERLVKERWPHMRQGDTMNQDLDGYAILAEKVGCHRDTIDAIVRQSNEGADFNLVDQIFCSLGRPDLWWGQLSDIYWDVDMTTVVCRRDGCKVSFVPRPGGRNGPESRQMYCSRKCRHMDWKVRRGIVKDGKKRNLSTHCRRGHPRATTAQIKSGDYTTCALCIRERRAEARARRSPEKIERERAYQRDYYRKRKAALAA